VKLWIDNAPAAAAVKAHTLGNGLAILALEHDYPIWSEQKIRQAGKPEDSLILADIELPTRFVGADRYRIAGDSWIIDPELPFDGRWHGAAVMAESDGALLGLVLIDDDDVKVVPVPAAAITTQIEETRETREKTPK
jgi:hypothetical protein